MTTTDVSEGTRGDAARPLAIEEAKLGNGMRIVVIPDRRAPVLTHMVWYRNGAADDPVGKSGIAHFLEHLMFKGTPRHPAGRFSAMISEVGGEENAFTSQDFTAYFQRVPKHCLRMCMEYEADRMKNLVFDEAVVEPERNVVLEERRMRTDSSPYEILNESLRATLFTAHPYGTPIIGWQHEIEGLGKSDAFAYYQRFYSPENAILVVAGHVEPHDVIAAAADIYGKIEPFGEAPLRLRPRQPVPTTNRCVRLADAKVEQAIYERLHLVPSYRTAEPGVAESLDVLSVLLGTGQTCALHERLVMRDRLAISTGSYYVGDALDESYYAFYAVAVPGIDLGRIEAAIEALMVELASTGFPAHEIERAKTRLIADAIYEQDSQTSLANRYGMILANGGTVADVAAWPARIDAVDADSLRRALSLLRLGTSVCGRLEPLAA